MISSIVSRLVMWVYDSDVRHDRKKRRVSTWIDCATPSHRHRSPSGNIRCKVYFYSRGDGSTRVAWRDVPSRDVPSNFRVKWSRRLLCLDRSLDRWSVSIDTAHIYVLCVSISLALSCRSLPTVRCYDKENKIRRLEFDPAGKATRSDLSICRWTIIGEFSLFLPHGGRIVSSRPDIDEKHSHVWRDPRYSGIFIVDTECRKRPEKFKSTERRRGERRTPSTESGAKVR